MKRLLAAAAACLLTSAAYAADFRTSLNSEDSAIGITGRIETGDDEALRNLLLARAAEGKETKLVRLNSQGGLLDPAYKMALILRVLKIGTLVGNEDQCISACMIIFAGGIERYVWDSAYLGVHSAAEGSVESAEGTVEMIRFMKELGVPANILGIIATTENANVTWLKYTETMGWVNTLSNKDASSPPVPHSAPAPTAPAPALSKRHYMTCQSTVTKGTYEVIWNEDRDIWIAKRFLMVDSVRPGNDDPTQTVVSGKTLVRNGKFAAVFDGTYPKIFFWTNKDKAQDRCWN